MVAPPALRGLATTPRSYGGGCVRALACTRELKAGLGRGSVASPRSLLTGWRGARSARTTSTSCASTRGYTTRTRVRSAEGSGSSPRRRSRRQRRRARDPARTDDRARAHADRSLRRRRRGMAHAHTSTTRGYTWVLRMLSAVVMHHAEWPLDHACKLCARATAAAHMPCAPRRAGGVCELASGASRRCSALARHPGPRDADDPGCRGPADLQ